MPHSYFNEPTIPTIRSVRRRKRRRKASPRQIEANRQNAKRSTGPKTQTGKAVSSQNAAQHNAYAKVRYIELPQFALHLAAYTTEHRPQSPTEQALVDHLAQAQTDIERFRDIELDIVTQGLHPESPAPVHLFNFLQRSQNAAHRRYMRSLEQLLFFKSQRPAEPLPIPHFAQNLAPQTNSETDPLPPSKTENDETNPNPPAPVPLTPSATADSRHPTFIVEDSKLTETVAKAINAMLDVVFDTAKIKKRINADCFTEGVGRDRSEQFHRLLNDVLVQMATKNFALCNVYRVLTEDTSMNALVAGARREQNLYPVRTPIRNIPRAELYTDGRVWTASVWLER